MAITIEDNILDTFTPTHSDILYVVTSNSSSNDNYSYVTQIRDSTDTLKGEFRTSPNQDGIGVFNLAAFYRTKLENEPLFTGTFINSDSFITKYKMTFGEEWSDSPSGSIVLYDGIDDTPGDPAVSASLTPDPYNWFINGVLNRNEGTSFNWTAVTDYYNQGAGATGTKIYLTDMPLVDIPIRSTDYFTIGVPNGDIESGSVIYNDIYRLDVSQFDSAGASTGAGFQSTNVRNAGANSNLNSPRLNVNTNYTTIEESLFGTYSNARLTLIGMGFANSTVFTKQTGAVRYEAAIKGYQSGATTLSNTAISFKFTDDECAISDTYRLMWLNDYGCFDFYNFTGQDKIAANRGDKQYLQTMINYGTDSTSDAYNVNRRGTKNYSTQRDRRYNVSTQWLTQEWADWMEGLFLSPSVYLLDGVTAYPINLTTATYNKFTNARTEKLKQYSLEFKYSNSLRTL